MGSLGALKASMAITLVLITLAFLILLVIIDLILMLFGVFCNFFILLFFAILFISIQWLLGPKIVKWSARIDDAAERRGNQNRFLVTTVKGLTDKAGIPMPRLAIIENPEPNAFVFGTSKDDTWLVVHSGLLEILNKDEIEGVLAHEVGHLKHGDCTIMTVASAIPLLMYVIARMGLYAMYGARRSGKDSGKAIAAIIVIAIVSFLVYLLTQAMVLYLSRSREYYADSFSARITRSPEKLRSALVKITTGLSLKGDKEKPSGLRCFYIGDPVKAANEASLYRQRMGEYDLDGDGVIDEKELEIAMRKEKNSWTRANELFSTHPHIYKRILTLRQMELEMDTLVVSPIEE